MMSLPSKGLFLIEFFEENIRTFEAKHPYFRPKKSDVLHFPKHASLSALQKKFLKISYISYTKAPDAQYLLIILGEG